MKELSDILSNIPASEIKSFETKALEQLQEAGYIEAVFDRVSDDPILDECYYEGVEEESLQEFVVLKILFFYGLFSDRIKNDTVSYFKTNHEGRIIIRES
jgi:hypothetical protein